MDFQISTGEKQRCPKCSGTNLTALRRGGETFLVCPCGWKRSLTKSSVEYGKGNISPQDIMRS